MNPIDHPHGGGEGRAPIGRKKPTTPWGYPVLGKRSRKRKKYYFNHFRTPNIILGAYNSSILVQCLLR
ncbi:hypothetical protein J5N97_013152 [Dioscorea zingiberensis]|uniref:Ribosomal protein L2 n=1 Tax=Dioscorea zingiberensis TaxID=325984 RepID=A0A9D5CSX2_9LILI|nr:hypothetical protein J5N97_013152 [Dioscorea zingiberensis]